MLLIASVGLLGLIVPPPSHMEGIDGFETSILATEPMIQDAVAFWITPDGQLFVAETERTEHGTMDNRSSAFWLNDDLQAQTIEDRLAYYEKWVSKRTGGMAFYSEKPDRVRRSIDRDGDGVYDEFSIFGGPFTDPLDGIGAGVMQVGNEVWYTNIPHLWRLKDSDGDGVAELQEPIYTGFGIRTALYGHDMHGLVHGMDGRIYFSIGDRGYNVTTSGGDVFKDPRAGAVFRCESDGSNLELFHTGLRNPQELAFNAVGDLFTGDNNSDAGDRARIVFVAQNGETGWAMDYQTLGGSNVRGPWSQEAIWEVESDANRVVRPTWTLPPLAHVGAGPSGFAYYPGLGLPEAFDDHLFMCDFTGGRGSSSIWSFQALPKGAGYEIVDVEKFLRNVLCTDVMFDWNGRVLVSEWGSGWASTKKGMLHAAKHPTAAADPRIAEARTLMVNGLASLNGFELADLLAHPDQRLRLEVQRELASRGDVGAFEGVLRYADERAARLHAIWGLGQIARGASKKKRAEAMEPVLAHLRDGDSEVRAQAAKVLGDPPVPAAVSELIEALSDAEPRVRYHAAMSLGAIKSTDAIPFLVGLLMENNGRDRHLQHAASTALWKIGDRAQLVELSAHPMSAVRMGALLALRRTNDPALERMLFDEDLGIAVEAARAVHDKPIPEAMAALASLADLYASTSSSDDPRVTPLVRRIISANQYDDTPEATRRLASLAANANLPSVVRLDALDALKDRVDPSPRNRVNGYWRPVGNAPRDKAAVHDVLALALPGLARDPNDDISTAVIELGGMYGVALNPDLLFATVEDSTAAVELRVASIMQLPEENAERLRVSLAILLEDAEPAVRTAARQRLLIFDEASGEEAFLGVLGSGTIVEQQAAIAALSQTETDRAAAALHTLANQRVAGELASALNLDVLEAEGRSVVEAWFARPSPEVWSVLETGGDVRLGKHIVQYHSSASCLRCHKVDGVGGDAGPSLDGVGTRLDREHLVESLISPQAVFAEGFTDSEAMPNMRALLTPRELRDVVAFLETLQTEASPEGH